MDWVFRPAHDLELKQYMLLAYLQHVGSRFAERKLYPHLDALRSQVHELGRVRREKEQYTQALGGDIIGFDTRTGEPLREAPPSDPWLDVIDEIIEQAVPGLQRTLAAGSELRAEIVSHIHFAPVGLLPLSAAAGWILLRNGRDGRVYQYELVPLHTPDPNRNIDLLRTRYVTSYSHGPGSTFEHIKANLLDTHRALPNPAVFGFESDVTLPYIETYIPLAKRLVYEEIKPRE